MNLTRTSSIGKPLKTCLHLILREKRLSRSLLMRLRRAINNRATFRGIRVT